MNHWTTREEELGMEETSAVFPLDEKGGGAVLGCKSPILSFGAAAKQQSVLEKEYICLFQIYCCYFIE